jgi:hypothetical protein
MPDIKDAGKALNFLQKTGLINLETPISKVVAHLGELDVAGGGGLILWDRFILVTAPCSGIVAIGERSTAAGTPGPQGSASLEIGEAPRK